MDRKYSDTRHSLLNPEHAQDRSVATTIAIGIGLLYLLHQSLVYFDYPILPPQELLWNAIVYILPKQLLLDRARRRELQANDMLSQTHAAKSDALRRMLGIGGNALLQKLPAEGIMRRASSFGARLKPTPIGSDAPAGLGNWDNSCYQNSVLQGLASLDSLKDYLRQGGEDGIDQDSTTENLWETISKLNNSSNNGKHLWTPAKLKSMSSWQQQDAQEYFSKIMDELDKDSAKVVKAQSVKPGLEVLVGNDEAMEGTTSSADAANDYQSRSSRQPNPLDGLLAQRVTCTRCGYSEGLSMIPFNCLTVPLGPEHAYNLTECLDDYTKLEEIPEVECSKCTLLRAEKQLENMLPSPPTTCIAGSGLPIDSKPLALPPELRAQAFQRLSAIKNALDRDDFADKTLNETCSIPKKARVSSTKTRQAVVGRAPKSLVVHVNRSVFDEMTGVQRKNYAAVRFPAVLDLRPWIVNTQEDNTDETTINYRIKAVVTHYGRHENGHYICYRQHPVRLPRIEEEAVEVDEPEPEDDDPSIGSPVEVVEEAKLRWWRLSDEDVSPVSEDEVLAQNGVFMLFYERDEDASPKVQVADGPVIAQRSQATAESEVVPEITAAQTLDEMDTSIPMDQYLDDDTTHEQPATPSSTTADSTAPSTEAPDSPHTLASTAPTTEDELEMDSLETPPPQMEWSSSTSPPSSSTPPTPSLMRTAHGSQASNSKQGRGRCRGFDGGELRAVAAS